MADLDAEVTDSGSGVDGISLGTSSPSNAGTSKIAYETGVGSESVSVIKNGVWPYVYPFTAVALAPTHTWGRVLRIDEVNGTQEQ